MGLLFPTSGQALVFGRDATDVTKNERIGYLPEESYLYKFLSAEETLDFYGRLFKMSRRLRRQRTAELIEQVGLVRAKRRQLREYSKGMTRRIGLAQALINDPELILLDEPTTGLDPLGTRDMKQMILDLRDQGKTIVMCSHQLDDVQDVCDRIAILYEGELKELGRVDSLLKVRDVTEIHAKKAQRQDPAARSANSSSATAASWCRWATRPSRWNGCSWTSSRRARPIRDAACVEAGTHKPWLSKPNNCRFSSGSSPGR